MLIKPYIYDAWQLKQLHRLKFILPQNTCPIKNNNVSNTYVKFNHNGNPMHPIEISSYHNTLHITCFNNTAGLTPTLVPYKIKFYKKQKQINIFNPK